MPGFERAELTVELRIAPSDGSEEPPRQQTEAFRRAAAGTGLAREAGPETILLAGGRGEVLEAAVEVLEAALDAGVRAVQARVETDAPRFDEDA